MIRTFGIIVLIGALFVGLQSVYTVNEMQQALIVRLGEPVDAVNEVGDEAPGLHFKVPFIMDVLMFDKRNLEFNMDPEEIQASDQVRIVVDAFLRYRIVDPLRFYQTVRNEAEAQSRLRSIMDDSLRGVIASIPSQDVVSGQRAALMERVQTAVEAQVSRQNLGIQVIDVRILRADLPPQIAERVFQRMRSEREQRAAQIRAVGAQEAQEIRADADRQATIIRAEARADSERLRGEGDAQRSAIYAAAYGQDPEFYAFYRSMIAYQTAVGPGTPIIVAPDSEFFDYFRSETGRQ